MEQTLQVLKDVHEWLTSWGSEKIIKIESIEAMDNFKAHDQIKDETPMFKTLKL